MDIDMSFFPAIDVFRYWILLYRIIDISECNFFSFYSGITLASYDRVSFRGAGKTPGCALGSYLRIYDIQDIFRLFRLSCGELTYSLPLGEFEISCFNLSLILLTDRKDSISVDLVYLFFWSTLNIFRLFSSSAENYSIYFWSIRGYVFTYLFYFFPPSFAVKFLARSLRIRQLPWVFLILLSISDFRYSKWAIILLKVLLSPKSMVGMIVLIKFLS